MFNLSYNCDIKESANATLDFIESRPFLKFTIWFMNLFCILVFATYAYLHFQNMVNPQHIFSAVCAVSWLLFRRRFNGYLLRRGMKKQGVSQDKINIKVDKNDLEWKCNDAKNPKKLSWKSLKFIYKNNDGYLIPITGIKGIGRFVWMPKHSFRDEMQEISFVELVKELKLKIKKI